MYEEYLVFDLETQRDIRSVGGRNNIDKLKLSLGVVWNSKNEEFKTFYEEDIEELYNYLTSGQLVVGYNHIYFDYTVLAGHLAQNKKETKEYYFNKLRSNFNFDILLDIKEVIGHLVSLNSLVKPTLQVIKSADGLQALEWYRQYSITKDKKFLNYIEKYCQKDVELTNKLYKYGKKEGKIFHESRNGDIKTIIINWKNKITKLSPPKVQEPQLNLF